MTEIVFTDPPPDSRSNGSVAIAAALKARPGEWALVRKDSSATYANNIKKGQIRAFQPAGSFEAVSRPSQDGKRRDIYARYVGAAYEEVLG